MTHINDPFAPMIYATQPPDVLTRIQQEYGEQAASRAIEHAFARLSAVLQAAGVNTLLSQAEKHPAPWWKPCR